MKKALSLILAISLIFCALPVMGISAEDAVSEKLTVNSAKAETTTISGDDVNGYTIGVNGTGRTYVMTTDEYPMQNLSFDFGYQRTNIGNGYGEFAVTTVDDVETVYAAPKTSANTLVFLFKTAQGSNSNQRLDVFVVWTGGEQKLIGSFDYATYRPGDDYRNQSISNIQFVLDDAGKLRLAVDGNLCTNSDYSCLNYAFNKDNFINNEKVHIVVGGYQGQGTGTAYFKQLSSLSGDNTWESRAVDSFIYNTSLTFGYSK